jgi:o-succinylbenzoate synthase
VKLDAVELRRVAMPLVRPFRTAFGTQSERDVLLVRVVTADEGEGWGECVAPAAPIYSSEWTDGAAAVTRRFLAPLLLAADELRASDVGRLLSGVVGHRMAKAALEMAVLDAELRVAGRSFAERFGASRERVPCGVSVGIAPSVDVLIEEVGEFLDRGYVRIKLKIEPGWDREPVAAVRDRFGDDVPLQVDGNAGYRPADLDALMELDHFGLLLIEQPFGEEELLAHARLASRIGTPVCLDESITSAQAALDAVRLGACSVVNIKAGRVGGYLEAVRIHDRCVETDVPVWCGGMLETGLGRAANLALAALPGMSLPGDTSASDRYFARDLTAPFALAADGTLPVPSGPGLGVVPLQEVLEEATTRTELLRSES